MYPYQVWKHFFVEIVKYDHFLPSADSRGQFSVSDERMCINTGYSLRGLSLPRKNVVK